eukprot:comp20734_c0_seq1/m.27126 comp20734_c0_seq1/g.27126  ORF comp20734_c0_seq1/g.27126 comp20734_c0_seq1/m.27126 type:complete len:103 (+) comp20734_c0_seq1:985-1293(+)
MAVRVTVRILSVVMVGVERMREEMKEDVTKKATGSKGQQGVEQLVTLCGLVADRDEGEDEDGGSTDYSCGPNGLTPHPLPLLFHRVGRPDLAMHVTVVIIPV